MYHGKLTTTRLKLDMLVGDFHLSLLNIDEGIARWRDLDTLCKGKIESSFLWKIFGIPLSAIRRIERGVRPGTSFIVAEAPLAALFCSASNSGEEENALCGDNSSIVTENADFAEEKQK